MPLLHTFALTNCVKIKDCVQYCGVYKIIVKFVKVIIERIICLFFFLDFIYCR